MPISGSTTPASPGSTHPANEADLRKQILSEVTQHPVTLVPLCAAAIAGAYAGFFGATAALLNTCIGGVALGTIGWFYNLLVRGEVIRDRILEKWKTRDLEHRAQVLQQMDARVRELLPYEMISLWENLVVAREHVTEALAGRSVASQGFLGPQLDQNFDDAMELFRRAADQSARMRSLGPSSEVYRGLLAERSRITEHIRQLIALYEKVAIDLATLEDASELEVAGRKLRDLERAITASRKVYDILQEEPSLPAPDPATHYNPEVPSPRKEPGMPE